MDFVGIQVDIVFIHLDIASIHLDIASIQVDVASIQMDIVSIQVDVASIQQQNDSINQSLISNLHFPTHIWVCFAADGLGNGRFRHLTANLPQGPGRVTTQ